MTIKKPTITILLLLAVSILRSEISINKAFGVSSWDERSVRVVETPDDGFLMMGYAYNGAGVNGNVTMLIKIDNCGAVEWQKHFGVEDNSVLMSGTSIILTQKNDFLISGIRREAGFLNQAFVSKVDLSGNLLWARTYSVSEGSEKVKAIELEDETIIIKVISTFYSGDYSQIVLMKTDASGSLEWGKVCSTDDGSFQSPGLLRDIVPTKDGSFLGVGNAEINIDSVNSRQGGIVAKFDNNGEVERFKFINMDYQNFTSGEEIWSIKPTLDNGYVVIGRTASYLDYFQDVSTGQGRYYTDAIKLDYDFDVEWSKVIAFHDSMKTGQSWPVSIAITEDNEYAFCTNTTTISVDGNGGGRPTITKLNNEGNLLWQKNYGPGGAGIGNLGDSDCKSTSSNGFVLSSIRIDNTSNGSTNLRDAWLLTVDENGDAGCESFKAPLIQKDYPLKSIAFTPQMIDVTNSITVENVTFNELSPEVVSSEICTRPIISAFDTICEGNPLHLVASGAQTYRWENENGEVLGYDDSVTVFPEETTTFYLHTNYDGCDSMMASTEVMVQETDVDAGVDGSNIISRGQSVQLFANGGVEYEWSPYETLTGDSDYPVAFPLNTTTYEVLIDDGNGCIVAKSIEIIVIDDIFIPNVISINNSSTNNKIALDLLPSAYDQIRLNIYDRLGKKVFTSDDYNAKWQPQISPSKESPGVYTYELLLEAGQSKFTKLGNVTILD